MAVGHDSVVAWRLRQETRRDLEKGRCSREVCVLNTVLLSKKARFISDQSLQTVPRPHSSLSLSSCHQVFCPEELQSCECSDPYERPEHWNRRFGKSI